MATGVMSAGFRGSRKHVLDWTSKPTFLRELAALVVPARVEIVPLAPHMPRGDTDFKEARLDTFGPMWLPGSHAWQALRDWWLAHPDRANTPNWDIAVGCLIEDRPGFVLVEAKANWPELGPGRKRLDEHASTRSLENHEHIAQAIGEACRGWQVLDSEVHISMDSHYQLANRLAFTWKLATLGIPVVLVYLGFTGDSGIADAGRPFADSRDWDEAFSKYAYKMVPPSMFERRLEVQGCPVWLLSRSCDVIEVSPSRSGR